MTDMIAQDLQDMAEHPVRTVVALVFTLIIMLGCPISCVAFFVWIFRLVIEVM